MRWVRWAVAGACSEAQPGEEPREGGGPVRCEGAGCAVEPATGEVCSAAES